MTGFNPTDVHGLILDMDGVLWRGAEPVGDLASNFQRIARRGCRAVLATNNATRTPDQYLSRLREYGVELEPWQVINSAQTAARLLRQRYPEGGPVYIIGEDGLHKALEEQGFFPAEENLLAVVAGLDRSITYPRLRKASMLVRSGVFFLGTNPDPTYPAPDGLEPGAGSILAMIETASGVSPVLAGKPEPAMYQVALERLGTAPHETLVVGDRLETDITGAQTLGCLAGVVLSGVSTLDDIRAWSPAPHMIANDLAALLDELGF